MINLIINGWQLIGSSTGLCRCNHSLVGLRWISRLLQKAGNIHMWGARAVFSQSEFSVKEKWTNSRAGNRLCNDSVNTLLYFTLFARLVCWRSELTLPPLNFKLSVYNKWKPAKIQPWFSLCVMNSAATKDYYFITAWSAFISSIKCYKTVPTAQSDAFKWLV